MILKVVNLMRKVLLIATGGDGEEGEKVDLKICLAGELNPGLQLERREH